VYTTPTAVTDSTGRFSIDLYRLASEAAPTASGNLYLRMALVREVPVRDSLLAEIEFAPVGELIPRTEIVVVFDTTASAGTARVGA
jgi:hypothetical protein